MKSKAIDQKSKAFDQYKKAKQSRANTKPNIQALLYGFLGVRAHLDHMEVSTLLPTQTLLCASQSVLQLAPKLPPACSKLTLTGLELHAAKMDLVVTSKLLLIDVTDPGAGLEVSQEGEESILVLAPQMINLTLAPVSILPLNVPYLDSCTLPADTIGIPRVLV